MVIFVLILKSIYTYFFFFFSSRRRHTRYWRDWSSDVCSSDLEAKYQFTPKIAASLRYKYNGKYSNFSDFKQKEEEGYIKSHAVTDFSLHYQNEKGFHLYGGINNIFNEKYFEYTSSKMYTIIPAEERTFFVGAKYQF